MTTRKEQLFSTQKKTVDPAIVSSRVRHVEDKSGAKVRDLSSIEKMLCALRKVLAESSAPGARYYISSDNVKITKAPEPSDPKVKRTYTAAGYCRLGVHAPDNTVTFKSAEFNITFRDIVDSRGLPDVEHIDPTTLELLDPQHPIDLSSL